ncbi:hypothetical protein AWB81_00328 [Caballeronia arationis]|uniref:hypothetical protein n=1 Tax=Caballeronia arationis TaxID=1777142 RepID=UPI00074D0FCE|nr:hypothetical protein [Caballeronia arationis]SAK44851.1 hypothetical protein AWB81_00328 [Caballeronia arationis]
MSLSRISNGFFFALWVAVCSAAPEFIWQGMLSVFGHFTLRDAAAALLIGLILAFFVEPLIERLRTMSLTPAHASKSPAFAACTAIGFAVAAVCVHEAITVSIAASHTNEQAAVNLQNAVSQALEWAGTPFAITVAWLSARSRSWIAWSVAVAAALVAVLSGVVFEWGTLVILTSALPGILILAAGMFAVRETWDHHTFRRCARVTAVTAIVWLVVTGALQAGLSLAHVQRFEVYDLSEYWIDFRFYLGWVVGLLVAPDFVGAPRMRASSDAWRGRR